MVHRGLLSHTINASRREVPPQRRRIFQYALSHPDEATLLALSAAAASIAGHRIWKLESRTRELESSLISQREYAEVRMRDYESRERELRISNDSVRRKYDAMREEKARMEASIIERGRMGEMVLMDVLDECKARGLVKDFVMQRVTSDGKRPDAEVEVVDGIFVVIDSKAPIPPYDVDDASRKEYVDKLKDHVRQLGDKRYYASTLDNSTQCSNITLMMLPGEGYLQAAYENGRDVFELNRYARDRNVLVVGPNGLRTSLQVWKMRFEEEASKDRLDDERIRDNIVTTLQPLWVDSLLPFVRGTGILLEKAVSSWNSRVDDIVAFDKVLRSKDVLDLARTRKTELPKKIIAMPKSIEGGKREIT
jgi:DNA anti-recombination protein RmuC